MCTECENTIKLCAQQLKQFQLIEDFWQEYFSDSTKFPNKNVSSFHTAEIENVMLEENIFDLEVVRVEQNNGIYADGNHLSWDETYNKEFDVVLENLNSDILPAISPIECNVSLNER